MLRFGLYHNPTPQSWTHQVTSTSGLTEAIQRNAMLSRHLLVCVHTVIDCSRIIRASLFGVGDNRAQSLTIAVTAKRALRAWLTASTISLVVSCASDADVHRQSFKELETLALLQILYPNEFKSRQPFQVENVTIDLSSTQIFKLVKPSV